jgi:hypothetical protein
MSSCQIAFHFQILDILARKGPGTLCRPRRYRVQIREHAIATRSNDPILWMLKTSGLRCNISLDKSIIVSDIISSVDLVRAFVCFIAKASIQRL